VGQDGFGLLMVDKLFSYAIWYSGGVLYLGLFLVLLRQGRWKRLKSVFFYIASLLAFDCVGRQYFLYRYGWSSREYAYFFWLTDVLLALAAFLVVCSFFRRACLGKEKMWRSLRLMLAFVFALVVAISGISLSRHYDQLFSRFIIEFQQNLFFTCLVLNTLLYLLIQQIESGDEELALLVCGMGIQFAGPAANLALVYLTPGQQYAGYLYAYLSPLCTLGMLLTWFYAISWLEKRAPAPASGEIESVPVLAEATLPGFK
jgi:hypothetical protein